MKNIPNGVFPTMITPYTADNKVDYDAVLKILDWYGKKGVEGIFAICQSSEIFFLSFEERLELIKFIVENAPKGVSIVASGHTADDLDKQAYEAEKFIDTGIDAYVFISNRFASADEDDSVFLKNMYYVMDKIKTDIGYGIYECPYPYKRLLSVDVMKEIGHGGRFQFLKDTSCNTDDIKAKLAAVEGTQLKIYNANAATLLETLREGAAGFSGVMANFHPEIYVWLCKHFAENPEKADLVQSFLGFASLTECQQYPVNAKYYLGTLEGLDFGYSSRARDCSTFKRNHMLEIEQLHTSTQFFKEQLGIK
ncbi:MAG: dihydrodipicolinate synthase family protein [Clostridia bacterium]|nr:dihydrodipicolinate synthase family protein [Clostridia bacterium]